MLFYTWIVKLIKCNWFTDFIVFSLCSYNEINVTRKFSLKNGMYVFDYLLQSNVCVIFQKYCIPLKYATSKGRFVKFLMLPCNNLFSDHFLLQSSFKNMTFSYIFVIILYKNLKIFLKFCRLVSFIKYLSF